MILSEDSIKSIEDESKRVLIVMEKNITDYIEIKKNLEEVVNKINMNFGTQEDIENLETEEKKLLKEIDYPIVEYMKEKNLHAILEKITKIMTDKIIEDIVDEKLISDTVKDINDKVLFPLLEELYEIFDNNSTENLLAELNNSKCGDKNCIEILNLIKDDIDVKKLIEDNDVKNSKTKETIKNLLIKINEILNFNKTKSGGNKNNFIDKLLKIKY